MKRVDRSMLMPDAQTGVPLTTRGDLVGHDGSAVVRLPVGADGQSLVADSTQAAGVRWGAAASGGGARIVGEVGLFARATAPAGWLACDGSSVSQSTYAALYAALGGDSSPYGHDATTFRVPDLRGRAPLGAGSGAYAATVSAVDTATGRLTVAANDSLRTGTAVVYLRRRRRRAARQRHDLLRDLRRRDARQARRVARGRGRRGRRSP